MVSVPLNIDEYWFISISPDDDFHIHQRHPLNLCFVKNYNPVLFFSIVG